MSLLKFTQIPKPWEPLPPGRHTALGNDAILEPDGKLHNPVKKCLMGSAVFMPHCMAFLRSLDLRSTEEQEKICWINQHKLLRMI